jgi:hypothetical protein
LRIRSSSCSSVAGLRPLRQRERTGDTCGAAAPGCGPGWSRRHLTRLRADSRGGRRSCGGDRGEPRRGPSRRIRAPSSDRRRTWARTCSRRRGRRGRPIATDAASGSREWLQRSEGAGGEGHLMLPIALGRRRFKSSRPDHHRRSGLGHLPTSNNFLNLRSRRAACFRRRLHREHRGTGDRQRASSARVTRKTRPNGGRQSSRTRTSRRRLRSRPDRATAPALRRPPVRS